MAANSKSQAISQTAYARAADGNLYAVWETACGVKGLTQINQLTLSAKNTKTPKDAARIWFSQSQTFMGFFARFV